MAKKKGKKTGKPLDPGVGGPPAGLKRPAGGTHGMAKGGKSKRMGGRGC